MDVSNQAVGSALDVYNGTFSPDKPQGAEHLWQFVLAFNPQGAVEFTLTRELARRAAELDEMDHAHTALTRAAAQFGQLTLASAADEASVHEVRALVASAAQSEVIVRRSLGAARAFCRALAVSRELQAERRTSNACQPDTRFMDETACLVFLRRRVQLGFVPCRVCGHRGGGHWLGSRRCWQCNQCKTQNGIRTATVMAYSPLDLTVWFAAIRAVLLTPTTSASQLAKIVRVTRAQTRRTIIQKIRAAMMADNASELLANLDQIYLAAG